VSKIKPVQGEVPLPLGLVCVEGALCCAGALDLSYELYQTLDGTVANTDCRTGLTLLAQSIHSSFLGPGHLVLGIDSAPEPALRASKEFSFKLSEAGALRLGDPSFIGP